MPVMFTCMAAGGCFFWGGVVAETKEECLRVIEKTSEAAEKDKNVKVYKGDCIKIRFEYNEKGKML